MGDAKGLGRLLAPDPRDAAFLLSATKTGQDLSRTYRYHWDNGYWGDQGSTPRCVAYAGTKYLEDGPVTYDGPLPDPRWLYEICQANDEWAGNDYDGTSVRAVAKVLSDLDLCREAGLNVRRPLVTEYRWAMTGPEVVKAILNAAPVLMGTLWTASMDRPNATGFVKVDPSDPRGGHAYLATGARVEGLPGITPTEDPWTWDWDRTFVRFGNSWGRGWGQMGRFYMTLTDVEALMANGDGEALIATEEPLPLAA